MTDLNDLTRRVAMHAATTNDTDISDILDEVLDVLERVDTSLAIEAEELGRISKEIFDEAHGKDPEEWEISAGEAMRYRIAQGVLLSRIEARASDRE